METVKKRRRVVVDESALAEAIGARIKQARLAAGLTQAQLAGDRYTKAYVSALEHGLAKPSMAALNYLAPRLGTSSAALIVDADPVWDRVSADLALASGDWATALDRYELLAERTHERASSAEIQLAMAECLCRLDRSREAIRPATEAAEAFREVGRPGDAARAEYWLASAQYQADNLEEARSLISRLIDRTRAGLAVAPDFRLRLLISAAMIEASAGASSTALAYLEEARGLTVDLDDRHRGAFMATLANAYREAGDLEAAIRNGQAAITLLRSAESDAAVLYLENDLALAYLANGNLARAGELAHDARGSAIVRHDETLAAYLAETEAQVALASGDPEAAVELATEALDLADRSGNEKARLDALVTRARARATMGDHAAAAIDFEAAAGLATINGRSARRREVLSAWADTLAALGQHDRAFALAREALAHR